MSSKPNYAGIIQYLLSNKDSISSFTPRDKHEVEFLFRMCQDYEDKTLPSKSSKAWEERVYLFYMVAEYGWPTAIEKDKEKRIRNFGAEFIPSECRSNGANFYNKRSRQESRSRSGERNYWRKAS
ncbi:unnamed protein product [Brachionus calyciflorus]|uniref:Uncharacterized protein n=1 Tax=Brachionus calyciflorus TaxID=104777 RepID=A0A813TAD8_9BILA|nr:unnamed protein product [Brachionus calyciflorus]